MRLPKAPSNPALNTSRDGATSLGNLFQCPMTVTEKNFLLMSRLNLTSYTTDGRVSKQVGDYLPAEINIPHSVCYPFPFYIFEVCCSSQRLATHSPFFTVLTYTWFLKIQSMNWLNSWLILPYWHLFSYDQDYKLTTSLQEVEMAKFPLLVNIYI